MTNERFVLISDTQLDFLSTPKWIIGNLVDVFNKSQSCSYDPHLLIVSIGIK